MPRRIDVHLLPALTCPEQLGGKTVIMVDLLRAGTTIVEALANGARRILPCLQVDQARHLAQTLPPDQVLLGGERGGRPIAGFDLGNSPRQYTSAAVRGKTICFTTTNGTRALGCCRQAAATWIGGFVNLSALCTQVAPSRQVAILCAGTAGEVSRDDVLLAGAIVYRLAASSRGAGGRPNGGGGGAAGPDVVLNDSAQLARAAWRAVLAAAVARGAATADYLTGELRGTQGGRNLLAIGQEDDLAAAAAIDRHAIVPRYDPASSVIDLP